MRVITSAFLAIGVVSLYSIASAANADSREVKYKDYSIELREGDRVSVTGVKGSVRLVSSPRALLSASGSGPANGTLRVRKTISTKAPARALEGFDQWTYTVRREENVVRIESKGPDSKADWDAQMKAGFPELIFELEAPAVPVEIALREGRMEAQNWKAPLSVHIVDGDVRLLKNEGALRVQVQRGQIRIDGHKGRVDVDGFNPKMQLANLDGDLNLDNFAGDSALQNLKGSLRLKAFSGQTVATQVDGACDFELGRGSLNLQGLDGGLRGQLDNGSISAKILGEPEVNIEAQEGSVSLNLPAGSGANVRLQTEGGILNAPPQLPTSRSSTQRFVQGRLAGSGKGSVFVKTRSGNVKVN